MDIEKSFYFNLTDGIFEKIKNEIILFSKQNRPDKIILDNDYLFEEGITQLEKIDINTFDSVMLFNKKFSINLMINNNANKILAFKIKLNIESYSDELFNHIELTRNSSFIYGKLINETDNYFQSIEDVDTLKSEEMYTENMKTYKDDTGLFEIIDISKNYGRSIFSSGILFCAGHKQWFSTKTFNVFPKKNYLILNLRIKLKKMKMILLK
jgi:hypothetical protein